MNVLILSTPQDVHAQAVSKHLSQLSAKHWFFRFEQLIPDTKLHLTIETPESNCSLKLIDGRQINFKEIDSVWFRRPGTVQYSGLPEPWMDAMVRNEGAQFVAGIFRSLDCLFVNHPGRDFDCSFKLWQLEVARRVGLTVPKTIVTNLPEAVAEFYERCNGEVIYKLIGERSNFYLPKCESAFGVPTLAMTKEDIGHLSQVAIAPHLFQERIDKVYDIRVTAMGTRLFPVKIDSQAGTGKLDWRTDLSVPMELIALPKDVNDACLRLLKELGLNYGAIDLCVDKAGRHVFFEINCAGQYLWMEKRIEGLELSLELAKLLSGQSEPMVPRASTPASEKVIAPVASLSPQAVI